ncbi:hypothetical protein BH11BAC5_BH11BAC5_54160 [soil metagenome]
MANALKKIMVADEIIVNKIYQIRQQKIMLIKTWQSCTA